MSELSIVLEGLPEKVQRVADVIEDAFPGLVVWVQSDDDTGDITIKIEGYEVPRMPLSAMTTDNCLILTRDQPGPTWPSIHQIAPGWQGSAPVSLYTAKR